jgi:hypothetical protein
VVKAQLRTHPKVKYHGARTWPPDLGGAYDATTVLPIGEQGILEDVSVAERDYIGPERVDLIVEYQGRRHSGQVWLDDPALAPRLCEILKKHIGSPITEISDLEVDL